MTTRPQATKKACIQLLQQLFDEPEQIMVELAPEGWQAGPLWRIFHPSAQDQYEAAQRMRENLGKLAAKKVEPEEKPGISELRLEDFSEDPPDAGNPADELLKLLGDCVWLLFSNNHTVYDKNDRAYNLGSFRGSAGFIAEFLNMHHPSESADYDYMDFYCAGSFTYNWERTTPVFEVLFQRLKAQGCDWEYEFPRLSVVDLSGLKAEMDVTTDDPAAYDPAKAVEKQLEAERKKAETAQFQEKLDEGYRAELEAAKYRLPPPEVQAYRNVYGHLPVGFPQV